MVFKNYDANFSAILPAMRSVAEITADVDLWRSGRATDVTKSQVAAIELQIRTGDDLYRRRQYEPALNQFRQARASIYALLYPGFNSSAYVRASDVILPASKALENGLLNLSLHVADSMRPLAVERGPLFPSELTDPLPNSLVAFTTTGFQESVNVDASLQTAAAQGVALLNDGKPEAAIDVMSDAVTRASAANAGADRALLAALNLNLASAWVQASDPAKAVKPAQISQVFPKDRLATDCSRARRISRWPRRASPPITWVAVI